MQEQAKHDFAEALYEIIARILETFGKKKENDEVKDGEVELSEKAKQLLNVFKEDPDLAKEVIAKYLSENIESQAERFKDFNSEALKEITEIKKAIQLISDSQKEIFNSLNTLEKSQLDKESIVNDVVSKIEKTNNNDIDQQREEIFERLMKNSVQEDLSCDEVEGKKLLLNYFDKIENHEKERYQFSEMKFDKEKNTLIAVYDNKDKEQNSIKLVVLNLSSGFGQEINATAESSKENFVETKEEKVRDFTIGDLRELEKEKEKIVEKEVEYEMEI